MNNKEGDIETLVSNIEQYIQNPALLASQKERVLKYTAKYGDNKVVYDRLVTFLEETAT